MEEAEMEEEDGRGINATSLPPGCKSLAEPAKKES